MLAVMLQLTASYIASNGSNLYCMAFSFGSFSDLMLLIAQQEGNLTCMKLAA